MYSNNPLPLWEAHDFGFDISHAWHAVYAGAGPHRHALAR